jgi:putative ABC transport system ATP-binding protein
VIRLRGITKSYALGDTQVQALRGIDLDVAQGEFCAIIGPSGSGKSSLLNILGCLDLPTAGRYELDGQPIVARDFDDLAPLRARALGFVFQSFNLVPYLDVSENVELALRGADGLGRVERLRRVEELIHVVGLAAHARHRTTQLSGGQQQRVAIARALAHRPRLLLADEPTASLDSENASSIIELLLTLNRKEGVTVLLSTHDPRVLPSARRHIHVRDGRIVAHA